MSALSTIFLWLLPLALLPVLIHLLNRLRYRTVRWAAMMFLRGADRDASRRAKIRQWLILAARCLMLAMFLLALSRLQFHGRFARFLDRGTPLVVVAFDRSASMEQRRAGRGGRERALALVQQGLAELDPATRVHWLDGATGERLPVGAGLDLARLPLAGPSDASVDVGLLLRQALEEVARAGVERAEIWLPSDRQGTAWQPPGRTPPDWASLVGPDSQITLRLLDVAALPPDPGNRSLQLAGDPEREGDEILVPLRLLRDTAGTESLPLRLEIGGLATRVEQLVEGERFQWTLAIPLEPGAESLEALVTLPGDANPRDNAVAIAWKPSGPARVRIDVQDRRIARAVRAALLPQTGQREVATTWEAGDVLWVRAGDAPDEDWVRQGGIVLVLPDPDADALALADGAEPLGLSSWEEQTGPLALGTDRQGLRVDLLRVRTRIGLPEAEGVEVLARLDDSTPFLTRERRDRGAVYRLATLPLPDWSNLDAGFVWVPMMQRLLDEGRRRDRLDGTLRLGEADASRAWTPQADGDDPRLHVGLFRSTAGMLATNRSLDEDSADTLSVEELQAWAAPLDLRVFTDLAERPDTRARRVELTSVLALLGLLFLAIESALLALGLRRQPQPQARWGTT
jgi:hypothetical protein